MLADLLRGAVKAVPGVWVHLSSAARTLYLKQFGSYSALRSDYWTRIYDAVDTYLNADRPITLYRNSARNLASDYFQEAAEIGYQDGGAELPLDAKTQSYVDARIAEEIGHVNQLFVGLRDNSIANYEGEAQSRADGYADGLDAIYNLGKLCADGNQMLTFTGDDGKESCPECQRMKDQRHRASWWVDNDLIPGPGNDNYSCNGYNCAHVLVDDDGNQFTE